MQRQQTHDLPDVKAAEDGKKDPRGNWQRNGEECGDYPVDPDSGHLKQGVTPDPHSVSAAHWHRLSDHVLKRHLKTEKCQISVGIHVPVWDLLVISAICDQLGLTVQI